MNRQSIMPCLALVAAGLCACVTRYIPESEKLRRTADERESIARLETSNAKRPDDPDTYIRLAQDYIAAGQNDKAIALIDRALANPKLLKYKAHSASLMREPSKLYFHRGMAYAGKQASAKAVADLTKAIASLSDLIAKTAGTQSQADGKGKPHDNDARADLERYYAYRAFTHAEAGDCTHALADVAKVKELLHDRDEFIAAMRENSRTEPERYPRQTLARIGMYPDRRASGGDFIHQLIAYRAAQEYELRQKKEDDRVRADLAKKLVMLLKCQSIEDRWKG